MSIIRDASEFYASKVADQLQEKGAVIVPEDVCNAFSDGANFVLDRQDKEITKLKEALREAVEVLAWYGDRKNCDNPDFAHVEFDLHGVEIADGGFRAREFQSKHAAIIEEVRK